MEVSMQVSEIATFTDVLRASGRYDSCSGVEGQTCPVFTMLARPNVTCHQSSMRIRRHPRLRHSRIQV
jgi:hypothetical protein